MRSLSQFSKVPLYSICLVVRRMNRRRGLEILYGGEVKYQLEMTYIICGTEICKDGFQILNPNILAFEMLHQSVCIGSVGVYLNDSKEFKMCGCFREFSILFSPV